jgi:geranylgeranyl diphosphate synthase type I
VVLSLVGSATRAASGWVDDLVRDVMADQLRTAVDRLPASVRDVVGYHLGWTGAGTPGKLVRPALALLSAAAVGGTVESAVDAAVAVELVHNAALLHDDVMGGALLRRHQETVWWRYGMPRAILAGDALQALAMELLAPVPGAVGTLSEAVRELAHGRCLDLAFDERDSVDLAECLMVAGARTAPLMRCACELGARYGGGQPVQIRALACFGWDVGVAYQLTDDLLGIWGDPRETGRVPMADLRAGKKTPPVVAALRSGSPDLDALYRDPEPLGDEDLALVADLVEQAGGRQWARAEARRRCHAALAALATADPVVDASDALAALAARVADRA